MDVHGVNCDQADLDWPGELALRVRVSSPGAVNA